MKACREISIEELKTMIAEMEKVYDIVRTVEPESTEVWTFNDDGTVTREPLGKCFSIWERERRCENCISLRACVEGWRRTKLEFRNEEVYDVVSMPLVVNTGKEKHTIALELANHVSDDILFDARGNGNITNAIKEINKRTYHDSLTGVFNRRYFDDSCYIYEMMNAVPKQLAFVLIDINSFKKVNDTYGHTVGDKLLAAVAGALEERIRKSDRVMRVGGDEFLVVLRECTEEFVHKKVESLKNDIAGLEFDFMDIGVTIAAGIAYSDRFDGTQKLVNKMFIEADAAMYADKRKMNKN